MTSRAVQQSQTLCPLQPAGDMEQCSSTIHTKQRSTNKPHAWKCASANIGEHCESCACCSPALFQRTKHFRDGEASLNLQRFVFDSPRQSKRDTSDTYASVGSRFNTSPAQQFWVEVEWRSYWKCAACPDDRSPGRTRSPLGQNPAKRPLPLGPV